MNRKGKVLIFFILLGTLGLLLIYAPLVTVVDGRTSEIESENQIETRTWDDYGTPICTAAGNQYGPEILGVPGGCAVITWSDSRTGSDQVYAQKINKSGDVQWVNNGVEVAPGKNPAICNDDGNGVIIAYEVYVDGTYEEDIYVQRINSSGHKLWGPNGVAISIEMGYQKTARIISDGSGGAIIAWQDQRVGGTDDADIYAQRVDSTGIPQWTLNGTPICTAQNFQGNPEMTTDELGGAIIVWQDKRIDLDIYAQRILHDETLFWTINGTPICLEADWQQYPQLCSDGDSGAIITWEDRRAMIQYDVYAARIDKTGATPWTLGGVPICTSDGNQQSPIICTNENGGAYIAWTSLLDGDKNIYAQQIDSTGTSLWTPNGTVICDAAGDQEVSDICSDDAESAFIVWEDRRKPNSDIYVNHINASGYVLWSNGKERCTQPSDQTDPRICSVFGLGSNAIMAWTDHRGGFDNTEIFCASINTITLGDIPGFEFGFLLLGFIASISIIFLLSKKNVNL